MAVTAVTEKHQISEKLIERWEQVCQKMQALAEAIPAEKFDYRPTEAARTVAEVLRHVAFWNQYVAGCAKGQSPDGNANEIPKDRFLTKTEILRAVKRSAAEAAKALKENTSGLSPEVTEMLVTFIEHNCEHYGQLAVYARLNGIVPPGSLA